MIIFENCLFLASSLPNRTYAKLIMIFANFRVKFEENSSIIIFLIDACIPPRLRLKIELPIKKNVYIKKT